MPSPVILSKRGHRRIEPSERSEDKEHVDVGSRIVDRRGSVRNLDASVGACANIDLVVPGSYGMISFPDVELYAQVIILMERRMVKWKLALRISLGPGLLPQPNPLNQVH